MHISYLISYLETIKQNSVSKAAKNLHMTQSALSQQIRSLERILNTELLVRSNKGVTLTEDGEVVLSYAETLVNIYDNMLKELQQSKKSMLNEIRISACNTVGEYMLPCTLHLYKKDRGNLKFFIRNEQTKDVIDHILDCSADIGFIDKEISIDGIECYSIATNNLVFILSEQNNAVKGDTISLEEIARLPLIIASEDSSFRQVIEDVFSKQMITCDMLNIEMELDSIESIKASVIANHGVSILPYTSVKKELFSKVLKSIPIHGITPSCKICMIFQKNRICQQHHRDFISYIKKFGRETFC